MHPDELLAAGRARLPAWGDDGPDADARYAEAVALITRAAEAGHQDAIEQLADGLGGAQALDWAIVLAKAGDVGPLVSILTDSDWPAERLGAVLVAARGGAPWAQLAVGEVYGLGMRDAQGLVAERDGGWGWLPGVAHPAAEARAWLERAAAAGWAAAALGLAFDLERADPGRALAHLRAAMRPDAQLTTKQRRMIPRLLAGLLARSGAPLAECFAAYEALAAAGDADALTWLADHHARGDGVPADMARARALYEAAAAAGHPGASRELGRIFEEGRGVPVDDARAQALYAQAAELGNDTFARERLAEKYGLVWYRT